MAIPYTREQTYQHSARVKKLVDNIFNHDPLLMRVLERAERSSGNTLQFPIEYAITSQKGWYTGMEALHTADEETDTLGEVAWKAAEVSVTLSNIDLAKNEGETKVLDLEKRAWEKAERTMKDMLTTSLYSDGTGSSSKEIVGLAAAIDDGSNTTSYAGINRTVETWWQSYYSNAAADLTLDIIRAGYSDVSSGNKTPTIIITDKDEFNAYEAHLEPNIRYTMEQNGGMKKLSRKGKEGGGQVADGGFEYLLYRNTPLVASEYITAGYMYLLYEPSLQWYFMKHPKFTTDKYGFAESPNMTPYNQDGGVKRIHTYCALAVNELRRNGKIIGLTD